MLILHFCKPTTTTSHNKLLFCKDNLIIIMYLIIDIGNTRVKAAVFKEDKITEIIHFHITDFEIILAEISEKYSIKKALVSAVGKLSKKSKSLLHSLFDCVELNAQTKLNFTNAYATPNTLGVDRIALAVAAVANYTNKNVLVIDAGTCVTFDFVTAKAVYLGGAISPGVQSRYKALHDYTQNLPLLEKKVSKNFIGNSTNTSIHSGVTNGISREIDGVIAQYKETYKKLTVVLTGGDADFLAGQLKSSIFVRPFFLIEGLFTILKTTT